MEQISKTINDLSEEEFSLYKQTMYNCIHPNSWIWNEEKVSWVAPKDYPNNGFPYIWSEEKLDWVPFPEYPNN